MRAGVWGSIIARRERNAGNGSEAGPKICPLALTLRARARFLVASRAPSRFPSLPDDMPRRRRRKPLDECRCLELVRAIENLTGPVRALADAGNREPERVTVLGQMSRLLQAADWAMVQRHGNGARGAGERPESNALVGKNVLPERRTNKTNFKQWGRRYKLVGGAKDEVKVLAEWAETQEPNAPAVAPEASNIAGAVQLAQHIHASRFMSTEVGTEARAMVNNS